MQEKPGIQLIRPTAAAASGENYKAGRRYFDNLKQSVTIAIHRRKIGGQSQSLALTSLSDDRTLSVGGLLGRLLFIWRHSLRSR